MYGSERHDPAAGSGPGRDVREPAGGPLDPQLIEVTDWTDEEVNTDAYLITPHSA
ncbi:MULTISPECIES: hypothetical protein [unclassified Streptomyces]|uniref:hypothetical protein n=1 Tax=unclassified Streptomyces TaxID=2593676 RepID=UPI0037F24128